MAANEINLEASGAQYREPNPSTLERVARDNNELGRAALHEQGYRIKSLGEYEVIYEPPQPGVLKFPPPRVQLPPKTADLHDANRSMP